MGNVMAFDHSRLFKLACLGTRAIGEFIEVTHGAKLDENASRQREEAKIGLRALVPYLLREAPRHDVRKEDPPMNELERFMTTEFLDS
jgi:hypothetical protein